MRFHARNFAILSMSLALMGGGCLKPPIEPQNVKANFFGSDAAIAPFEKSLSVGGIYTTIGDPKRLVSGARIDQFCDLDTEFYEPNTEFSGILVENSTETIDGNALANLGSTTFPGFAISLEANANRNGVYALTNVSRTRLSNSEVEVRRILSQLGAECIGFVREYQAQGRDVFVLLEGYKAETVTASIVSKAGASASASASISGTTDTPISVGFDRQRDTTRTASDVFVEVSGFKITSDAFE